MPILKHFTTNIPQNFQTATRRKVIWENTLTDVKIYCKAIVIKTVWYWYGSQPCSHEGVSQLSEAISHGIESHPRWMGHNE